MLGESFSCELPEMTTVEPAQPRALHTNARQVLVKGLGSFIDSFLFEPKIQSSTKSFFNWESLHYTAAVMWSCAA